MNNINKKTNTLKHITWLATIAMAFVMLFAVFIGTGCTYWETDYEWSEDSFYFSVTADREYARLGDTVTITATFKNTSGRNLRIIIPEWQMPQGQEQIVHVGWSVLIMTPPLRNSTLRNNEVVSRSRDFLVECIICTVEHQCRKEDFGIDNCWICTPRDPNDFCVLINNRTISAAVMFYIGRLRFYESFANDRPFVHIGTIIELPIIE